MISASQMIIVCLISIAKKNLDNAKAWVPAQSGQKPVLKFIRRYAAAMNTPMATNVRLLLLALR
jgi:hypothetical protein